MNFRTPYPYQQSAIDSNERKFGEFNRLLNVIPTGGGKTTVFSHMAKRRLDKQGERTLILAHREELIDQAISEIYECVGVRAEKEKAEWHASREAPIVVASVQSMILRLDKWPKDHFGQVICDEAHHSLSDSWQRILAHFDAQVLGVTATPDRGDARNLGEFYEDIAFQISLFELIDKGFLSRIMMKALPLSIDISNVGTRMDTDSGENDFNKDELGAALEPYLEEIAASVREHASFRRVLAFLPLRATSEKFVAACRNVGLTACHVDGESPNRKEILQEYENGAYDVLSNAMLLTEGYNCRQIDCVLPLRLTKSRALYCQMIGRGTRIHPLKENLLLLDMLWNHQKHAICRPAHLIAKSNTEADAITAVAQERSAALPSDIATQIPLDLQGLASDAQVQRENALRKQLELNRKKKAKFVSAEEFAFAHNSADLADYEPTMKWETAPVTAPQAKYLKRAGIDLDTVKGKGHATKLLDVVFRDTPIKLASPNAVNLMRRMPNIAHSIGIHDLTNVTSAQAGRFFAELKARKKQPEMI